MLRSLTVALIFALCAGLLATAQTNVAGTWTLMVVTDQGNNDATMTLEQEGDKLKGKAASPEGEFSLEGTITGDDINMTGEFDAQGQMILLSFTGKVDASTMKGTLALDGFTFGNWSAVKN